MVLRPARYAPTCCALHATLLDIPPGIGKSVFLLDLLHRLACMRRTVVLLSDLTYPSALLFQPAGDGGGVFAADNPIEFKEELNDPNTW